MQSLQCWAISCTAASVNKRVPILICNNQAYTGGPLIVWIQTVRFFYSEVNFLDPKHSILK